MMDKPIGLTPTRAAVGQIAGKFSCPPVCPPHRHQSKLSVCSRNLPSVCTRSWCQPKAPALLLGTVPSLPSPPSGCSQACFRPSCLCTAVPSTWRRSATPALSVFACPPSTHLSKPVNSDRYHLWGTSCVPVRRTSQARVCSQRVRSQKVY